MDTGVGPPPPPPPPPFQTAVESAKPAPVEAMPIVAMRAMHKGPPAAIAGAMLKDKKPFTYTPGGLDLSEIKSPRMQRRLQKNAACEGVQPSPLAQQPPSPSTPTSTPPLPPQGMVQVLPMPGAAMAPAPIKKPQMKEPPKPKPKRNVCGPPPPPPPFSISSSSADPSPAPTPYDSPSSTPAMNSTTSTSTPAEAPLPPLPPTSPPCTLVAASSTSSAPAVIPVENVSPIHPLKATEPGPSAANSVPTPPPIPPALRRRESQQDTSPTQVEAREAKLGGVSPGTIKTEEAEDEKQHEADIKEIKDLTSEINEAIAELKHSSVSPSPAIAKEDRETYAEEQKSKPIIEHDQKKEEHAEVKNNESLRPITPKAHESRWGIKDEELIQEHDIREGIKSPERISPVVRRTEEMKQNMNVDNSKRHSNQLEYSSFKEPAIQDAGKDKDNLETSPKQIQNKSPTPVTLSKPECGWKVTPIRSPHLKENLRPETIQTEPQVKSPPIAAKLPPPSSPSIKEKSESHENEAAQTKEATQRNRPWIRMASPPVRNLKTENSPTDKRVIRQASLPAQPSSPPSLPTANAGTLYIPPVNGEKEASHPEESPASSSGNDTAGLLDNGPLPWMRAHKKESSDTPEFMIQAQKTQERLQRQRSLTNEKLRRQHSDGGSVPNLTQMVERNAPQRMPYTGHRSDTVIPPPDIFKDQTSQPSWTSPPIQKTEQYREVPPPQAYQQPQSFLPNQFIQSPPEMPRPRERIIPIMLEGTPPTTPVRNFAQLPGYNQVTSATHSIIDRQSSLPKTPQSPYHTMPRYPTSPPAQQVMMNNPPTFNNSSTNAIEALQQMQQNLAQLNTGLQTSVPWKMQNELCKTLASRIAERSAQPPSSQNGGSFTSPDHMAAPNSSVTSESHPMQSRSFNVIQNVLANHDQNNSIGSSDPQPEPKKYTGSNIPSRSFKMLQAMTDNENDACQPGSSRAVDIKEELFRPTQPSSNTATPSNSNRVSPIRSYTSSPTIHYISNRNSFDSDPDSQTLPYNRLTPSYTTTEDSRVYRHVSPKLNSRDTRSEDRIVSKALNNRREVSPQQWRIHADAYSPVSSSVTRASSVGADSSSSSHGNSAHLNGLTRCDNRKTGTSSESSDCKLLYGGNKIPSRIFRQIQKEYSDDVTPVDNPVHPTSGSAESPSSELNLNENSLPRLVNRINLSNGNSMTSLNDEIQTHENIFETKSCVLKELTSHFDPKTHFKKPRAAPGKVFKYLQQTYDANHENAINGSCSSEGDSSDKSSSTSMSISSLEDAHYEVEPKPYSGGRIPGRTFRMLQDSIETHPSVLQARK